MKSPSALLSVVAVAIMLLCGCNAARQAVAPVPESGGSQYSAPLGKSDGVDPFNLVVSNFVYSYSAPWINGGGSGQSGGAIAAGPDGNLWIAGQNMIGSVTPTGSMTTYAAFTNGGSVAAGNGALWFDSASGNTIGKISTTGTIHYYPLPTASAKYVTKGPDGNMWFTEVNSKVGKITSSGVATEYDTGDPTSATYAIAAGPNGNLWFIDYAAQPSVDEITTTGTITRFPMPTGCAFDSGTAIAYGHDGNLWVGGSCQSGLDLFQVTPMGMITAHSVPYDPEHMVVGPDKQLWGVRYPAVLEEFNTTTFVTSNQVRPPHNGLQPGGITLGPDGDLWMTFYNSNVGQAASGVDVYEEKVSMVGIRLNGELSFTDPNYGFELGYAVGTGTQTQTISLGTGESVKFKNLDTVPHSAAFLGNATANNAPWPATFTGSTIKSPAGTAIGTTGWATGSLNPNKASPIYETGLPGFYMIGDQYDYASNNMRTVIVVH